MIKPSRTEYIKCSMGPGAQVVKISIDATASVELTDYLLLLWSNCILAVFRRPVPNQAPTGLGPVQAQDKKTVCAPNFHHLRIWPSIF